MATPAMKDDLGHQTSSSSSKRGAPHSRTLYDVHDLPFARESPYFATEVEKHRAQLRWADEHLSSVVKCSGELIAAMQSVGSASRNLAVVLERTPGIFQASSVVAALAGVLHELSSAEDVLAESLELSLAKPLFNFRAEVNKFDEMKRASDRADSEALAAVEHLLHGDWQRVERDVAKQRKALLAQQQAAANAASSSAPSGRVSSWTRGASRAALSAATETDTHASSNGVSTTKAGDGSGTDSSRDKAVPPSDASSPRSPGQPGLPHQGDLPSLASIIDERARSAAEKRRQAELRRFDLSRYVSSVQRRKGLVLAEVSVAALCSLRAFYAQASHAIGDAASAAHRQQTEIADACDREREPWDVRMLQLQRVVNHFEVEDKLASSALRQNGGLDDDDDPARRGERAEEDSPKAKPFVESSPGTVSNSKSPKTLGTNQLLKKTSSAQKGSVTPVKARLSRSSSASADERTEPAAVREMLAKAEAAHGVYDLDERLKPLHDEGYRKSTNADKDGHLLLEGYLFAQQLGGLLSRGRPSGAWQRRWFTLDCDALRATRAAPSWGGQLLRGVLAREPSTPLGPSNGSASSGSSSSNGGDSAHGEHTSSSSSRGTARGDGAAVSRRRDASPPTASEENDDEVVATLLLSSVRLVHDDRCAFEIHSAHAPAYRLQACGEDDCAKWIAALRDGVERRLASGLSNNNNDKGGERDKEKTSKDDESPEPAPSAASVGGGGLLRNFPSAPGGLDSLAGRGDESTNKPSQLQTKSKRDAMALADDKDKEDEEIAERLRQIEAENPTCADCGAAKPDWCSINGGVVVCLRCSGVHRSLGTHVSKVRSLRLDRISPLELAVVQSVGNTFANAVLEEENLVLPQDNKVGDPQDSKTSKGKSPQTAWAAPKKPTPETDAKSLADFVRAKWRDKLYVAGKANASGRDLRNAVRDAGQADDARGVFAALVRSGLCNTPPTDLPPLHLAARAKAPTVAALLVLNGARPDERDRDGKVALEYLDDDAVGGEATNESEKRDADRRSLAQLRRLLTPHA